MLLDYTELYGLTNQYDLISMCNLTLISHAYSPWWVELLFSLCKWEVEKQNTKGHCLKWCLWDLNLTVYLHSLWPSPAVQTHNHGSICTIVLVTLYLLNLKKTTDLNSLKTKIYFDLWFPCIDSKLLKYGQVVRPSITVVGMCGKGRGTLLTSCQKAERATEEGDGESCKPFKHISSVTRFVRSAPTFHISTNPNIVSNY